jgi:hypothetical protein
LSIIKLSITSFFIVLTLSLGFISATLPLSVNAQHSALSQSGSGNDSEQETNQAQSSEQDNQVISGDSSILSGNNLECQSINNSPGLEEHDKICSLEGGEPGNPLPDADQVGLLVRYRAAGIFDNIAIVTVKNTADGSVLDSFKLLNQQIKIEGYAVPFGSHYSVEVELLGGEARIAQTENCIVGPSEAECEFIADSNPKHVNVVISEKAI